MEIISEEKRALIAAGCLLFLMAWAIIGTRYFS